MPKTLATLRTNAKALADMDNTTFVTDAQWRVHINSGLKELYDILVIGREGYFESEYTTTTVANQSDYALPTDFMKLLDVDLEISGQGGEYYAVLPYSNSARNRLANVDGSTTNYAAALPQYKLRGGNLRLLPVPPAGLSLRLKYIPVVGELSDDADELSDIVLDQWSEYIEMYAAIRAMMKEDRDVGYYQRDLAKMAQRIQAASLNRDDNVPARIGYSRSGREFGFDTDVW